MTEGALQTGQGGSDSEPPKDRGRIAALLGMAGLIVLGGALVFASPRKSAETPPALTLTSGPAQPVVKAASADKPAPPPPKAEKPRPPPVWRVTSLKSDASIEVIEGTVGKRTLAGVLEQAGIAQNEIKKVLFAFDGFTRMQHLTPKDTFVLAKERGKGTVVAFELVASALDVYQARADERDGHLLAKKLELFVEKRRVATALVVSADLAKAVAAAGLREEILHGIDEALEGHVEPSQIRPGTRLRVVATEQWIEDVFQSVHVDAVEVLPHQGTPLRVYWYERDKDSGGNPRNAPLPGYYNAKSQQPFKGAFRSPVPLMRVSSKFNMKRMHPVLKVVMPHNGVDFRAAPGTPVFAASAGVVTVAGNGGPCGNMVEIQHAGGITTAYCHFSRIAPGIHVGQRVDTRQLIGYVGATGRATGPHLHFVVKKNGVYVDPMTLKMDGVRVLPPSDREVFAKRRAELDGILESIPVPAATDPGVTDDKDDKDDKDEPAD